MRQSSPNHDRPFRTQTLAALAGAIFFAFAVSLLLTLAGGDRHEDKAGANSSSSSALGHLGFYEFLGKLGYRASRGDGLADAKKGVVVLAEPNADASTLAQFKNARVALLVLPKRHGHADTMHPAWIDSAGARRPSEVTKLLVELLGEGEVLRGGGEFKTNLLGATPTIEGPPQLVKDTAMTPLVASDKGILLGEKRDGDKRLLVLADPDPIENHGLGKGDNAAFVAALIARLAEKGGRIFIDESIHGFGKSAPKETTPLDLLSQFPYSLAPLQILLSIGVLLAATIARFGAPERAPVDLRAGKLDLIANTARLLDFGRHRGATLRRYLDMEIQDAAQRLRMPQGLSPSEATEWLDRLGKTRGTKQSCSEILALANQHDVKDAAAGLRIAQAAHAWKKEILDGYSGRSHDR
jgi:hypothetical protein